MGAPRRVLWQGDLATADALLAWPTEKLFPGVDLARVLALTPAAAAHLAAGPALAAALAGAPAAPGAAATTNTLVALRLLANCAKEGPLRPWLLGARAQVRQR